jgi:peptidoglycan/LPS O-acetylase OafA/YrhL
MSSTTVRTTQLRALEGWRGVTAMLVVLYHFHAAHSFFLHEWLRYLSPVLEFFFIVSGFVMALGFSEKVKDAPTFWAFIVRRAGRVWPLHLAMLGLLLLIPLVRLFTGSPQIFTPPQLTAESLPYQVLLLQTWWPEIALTWNYPAWTLTGEMLAYLLMAIVLLVAMNERMRWALGLLIVTVAAALYYAEMPRQDHYSTLTVSRAVTGFFVGFLLFHFWRLHPLRNRAVAITLEIATIIGFIALLQWHPTGLAYFLSHALFALVIYTYASDLGPVSRLLSLPPFQWLGAKSFSIYMFHGVVTTWFLLVVRAVEVRGGVPLTSVVVTPTGHYARIVDLPQQWMDDLLVLGYFAVVLIGATFIYRWVEDPSRIYFAKLAGKMLARPDIARDARSSTDAARSAA